MSNILGIICFQGHSSAVALIRDGLVTDAIAEDRFSRRKQDTEFPFLAVDYLLEKYRLGIKDIDEIAFGWDPQLSLIFNAKSLFRLPPPRLSYFFLKREEHHGYSRFDKFRAMISLGSALHSRYGAAPKISYIPHHLAHSFSACLMTPHDHMLSVVADGTAEEASFSVYEIEQGRHQKIAETKYPHSAGLFYSTITDYLGFKPDSDEYKVMGLSSYGTRHTINALKNLGHIRNGKLFLDLKYFDYHRGGGRFFSSELKRLLGPAETFQQKADIAKAAQTLLEDWILDLIRQAVDKLSGKKPQVLCTSGGIFLNCLVNQRLRTELDFNKFHFSPIADDNGTALGAAASLFFKKHGKLPDYTGRLDLGPEYTDQQIEDALNKVGSQVRWEKLVNPYEMAAREIAQGRVIAFFSGRTEFGPRALGFRSILADPRIPGMKAILNEKVKLRETFRPFAPSVLREKAAVYFEVSNESDYPYMIETVYAKSGKRLQIPSVVHEDGTSRIQTVSKENHPAYYRLIEEFEKITGVPILLNTSFNLNQQPIVNSPDDALKCFLESGIDLLLMGQYLVNK